MKRSGMFAVLAAAAGLFGASAAWARSEFYVSPAGNDANEGTSEKPFASLEAARDAIRALKQRHGSPGGGVTDHSQVSLLPFGS